MSLGFVSKPTHLLNYALSLDRQMEQIVDEKGLVYSSLFSVDSLVAQLALCGIFRIFISPL